MFYESSISKIQFVVNNEVRNIVPGEAWTLDDCITGVVFVRTTREQIEPREHAQSQAKTNNKLHDFWTIKCFIFIGKQHIYQNKKIIC